MREHKEVPYTCSTIDEVITLMHEAHREMLPILRMRSLDEIDDSLNDDLNEIDDKICAIPDKMETIRAANEELRSIAKANHDEAKNLWKLVHEARGLIKDAGDVLDSVLDD